MPDDPRRPTPPRSASKGGRRPKFALPSDHHEVIASDRTDEHIEAFLDGPTRARRTRRRHLRPEGVLRPRSVLPLDTRTDLERAMRQEDARVTRYGRPASVIVVEVTLPANGAEERHIARVGSVIRAHARETDRVARVGPIRFHVLLPETDEPEATALAERVARACREALPTTSVPGTAVRAAAASPAGGGTLGDALKQASARIQG